MNPDSLYTFVICSKNEIERPWFRPGEGDPSEKHSRNAMARAAYEALMTVTLRKPDSDEYRNFSKEVKRRAKQEYEDLTYDEEEVCGCRFEWFFIYHPFE